MDADRDRPFLPDARRGGVVNPSDLAIIAMAVVSLASIARDYKVHMKVADRLRLVNPVKAPQPVAEPGTEAAAAGDRDKLRAAS
jgi:hypothetical protein